MIKYKNACFNQLQGFHMLQLLQHSLSPNHCWQPLWPSEKYKRDSDSHENVTGNLLFIITTNDLSKDTKRHILIHGCTVYLSLETNQLTFWPAACLLSVHVLCQRHPALHSPCKLSLHHFKSQHHEVTVLWNFCERNSFSRARFRLQWRLGKFPGLTQPSGGLTSIWAQSRYAAASKRFCDESPPPTSSVVEIIMYTHESRHPHPAFLRTALQRTACFVFGGISG